MADLDDQTPAGLQLHYTVDNLSAHFAQVKAFLDNHPWVFVHNTPTHASWLNWVELFFTILECRLKPFRWTYDGCPLRVA